MFAACSSYWKWGKKFFFFFNVAAPFEKKIPTQDENENESKICKITRKLVCEHLHKLHKDTEEKLEERKYDNHANVDGFHAVV